MAMFLSKNELEEMTGYQRPKSHMKWLSIKKVNKFMPLVIPKKEGKLKISCTL